MLSPERAIEVQTAIGSDIMMVLDVCVDSTSDEATTRAAMERTRRSGRCGASRPAHATTRPSSRSCKAAWCRRLRRESAAFLTAHPFDGFAIGGLAVGDTRAQREDITALAAAFPAARQAARYLMGVGTPPDLLVAMLAGVDMFDCIIPTQLATQGTAFTSTGRVRLTRSENKLADRPLDAACPCATCATFSRAYLHHLMKAKEPLRAAPRRGPQPELLQRAHGRVAAPNRARHVRGVRARHARGDRPPRARRRPGRGEVVTSPHLDCEVVLARSGATAIRDRVTGEIMRPRGPDVETAEVYLGPSRLAERLATGGEEPLVLDVGLGAGSNALAAWRLSESRPRGPGAGRPLDIVSFEHDLSALALALDERHRAAFGLTDARRTARRARSRATATTRPTARAGGSVWAICARPWRRSPRARPTSCSGTRSRAR